MKIKYIVSALCLALALAGCDSDDDLLGNYKATDVNIIANDINIGESVRTEVFFSTKVGANLEPDSVELVVRIPNTLQFEEGSSSIYDNSTDDTDSYQPTRQVSCADGSLFLVYDFSDDDLENRSLNGNDEFGIRFSVTGVSATPSAVIRAAANESQEFSCDSDFEGEAEESIEVKS